MAATMRAALSLVRSCAGLACSAVALSVIFLAYVGNLARIACEVKRWVVTGDHFGGLQIANLAPLLEQKFAAGELLGQRHLVEILGQWADAVARNCDQPVVGV